jgi:hypothetical protein
MNRFPVAATMIGDEPGSDAGCRARLYEKTSST